MWISKIDKKKPVVNSFIGFMYTILTSYVLDLGYFLKKVSIKIDIDCLTYIPC